MGKQFRDFFILVSVLSLLALNTIVTKWIANYGSGNPQRKFSFIGRDFPETPALSNSRKIVMVAEESVHYSIEGLETNEEWAVTKVASNGFLTYGPEDRAFALPMFHELHCLRMMRWAISGHYDPRTMGHMHHCLNYLRQEILCAADLTLEPADVLERDFNVSRAGATFVCSDWRVLYRFVEENMPSVFKSTKA